MAVGCEEELEKELVVELKVEQGRNLYRGTNHNTNFSLIWQFAFALNHATSISGGSR